jgi:hypothetical protein
MRPKSGVRLKQICLHLLARSGSFSDMKTFTLRDLGRRASALLDVCDTEGAVRIQSRDGRQYIISPEAGAALKVPWRKAFAEHRARIARIFPEPIPDEQVRVVDRLFAGG